MTVKNSNQISRPHWYSLGLPRSFQTAVWILVIIIFILSILDLAGWVFNITLFKSIEPQWIPMKAVSALCFILSASSLVLIHARSQDILKYWVSKVLSVIIFVISLVTVIAWLYVLTKGREFSINSAPLLRLFLLPVNRMPFLSALIFLFIGCILLLLSIKNKLAFDFAHFLICPAALASYFIPVSYILDAYYIPELPNIPTALNTGISFCALCLAILLIRPETWLMKAFTSGNLGGIMARRILPGLLLLPVLIGWFRIKGERSQIFESEVGVVLTTLTYTLCFVWLIWMAARSVNRIDERRRIADEALKKSYSELDIRVKERTAELLKLNKILDAEIIERKKAQEIVNAERKRFNELLELMPAYLILLTPDYHVSYANRYFRERFGEDRGRRCYEYLFNRTEPCDICDTYNVLKDNLPHAWEWTGPDGHNYSIFDFPFTDSDGSPLIMEMGIDVTDLKKAEANLKSLNAELEQKVIGRTKDLETANYRLHKELKERILADEALQKSESQLKELNATKDKFFNIVAHDLKNPFTSLLGSSELLIQNIHKLDNEKIIKLAKILNDSAKSGYAILLNLLDWSRSQTGMLTFNPEKINLRKLINENILNQELSSVNKEIEVRSEIKEDIFVFADKNMINTVLRNILSNAIKFTPRFGKVIVRSIVDKDKVIVSVKDTGIGISKENIENIFRIDAKFSVPGTENEQGTGLGLKLSKEFVEKQGGRIWVESIENEGSEFMFTIPIKSDTYNS